MVWHTPPKKVKLPNTKEHTYLFVLMFALLQENDAHAHIDLWMNKWMSELIN